MPCVRVFSRGGGRSVFVCLFVSRLLAGGFLLDKTGIGLRLRLRCRGVRAPDERYKCTGFGQCWDHPTSEQRTSSVFGNRRHRRQRLCRICATNLCRYCTIRGCSPDLPSIGHLHDLSLTCPFPGSVIDRAIYYARQHVRTFTGARRSCTGVLPHRSVKWLYTLRRL